MAMKMTVTPAKRKVITAPRKKKHPVVVADPEPATESQNTEAQHNKPLESGDVSTKEIGKDIEPKKPRFVGAIVDVPVQRLGYGHFSRYSAWSVIKMMPKHVRYVEPFAGGPEVLFAKEHEGFSERVNDSHGQLSNFLSMMDSPAFMRQLPETLFTEDLWNKQQALLNSGSPAEQARAFFIRACLAQEGPLKTFATILNSRPRDRRVEASPLLTALDGLPAVRDRVKEVVVLNLDPWEVIRQEDSPNTFFYIKPRCLPEIRACNNLPKTIREQQHELMELLPTIQGKFLLRSYPSPIYDTFAHAHDWQSRNCRRWRNSGLPFRTDRIEHMWMNY